MRRIDLRHNHPLRIHGPARIECVAGTVWLTVTGGAGDLFLRNGDQQALQAGEWALAEALGSASIRVRPARASWTGVIARGAAVLSSVHERLRTLRITWRRTPLAG